MESITAFLQPHTSSPSMPLIARAITSLIINNFSSDDLTQILSAQLDTLSVSAQAKQTVIPAILGIAKVTEVSSQRFVYIVLSSQSQDSHDTSASPLHGRLNLNALPGCLDHRWHALIPLLLIRSAVDHSLQIPDPGTPFGSPQSLIQASYHLPMYLRPGLDTFMSTWTHPEMFVNTGCLLWEINGNLFQKVWSFLSTMIGSSLSVILANQVGSPELQLALHKQGRRGR